MKTFILYSSSGEFNSANQKAEELLNISSDSRFVRYAKPRLVINEDSEHFDKYIFPIVGNCRVNVSGSESLFEDHFPSGQEFNMEWIASE